jgi:hypothetical protein
MRSGRQGNSLRAHSPTRPRSSPPGANTRPIIVCRLSIIHRPRLPCPSSPASRKSARKEQPIRLSGVGRASVDGRNKDWRGERGARARAAVPPAGGKVGGERPSLRRRCRTSDPGQAGAAIQVVGISTPRRLIDGIWACACASLTRGNSCVWGPLSLIVRGTGADVPRLAIHGTSFFLGAAGLTMGRGEPGRE